MLTKTETAHAKGDGELQPGYVSLLLDGLKMKDDPLWIDVRTVSRLGARCRPTQERGASRRRRTIASVTAQEQVDALLALQGGHPDEDVLVEAGVAEVRAYRGTIDDVGNSRTPRHGAGPA